jgi:uncharacterized protein YbbC (DUF1343 family)
MSKIVLGIENFVADPTSISGNGRVGLICNQSSVDHNYEYSADILFRNAEIEIAALFGPQHGIRGEVQDNMVETGHSKDERTGLPIYSLYSETRKPTKEMLEGLDTLIFDLQDIGGRVYTFIYTMANAMEACAEQGKRFIVLDRPNPIGGTGVEGNLLEQGHQSFVGKYPIPMRHGMTVGELALLFNEHFKINCDLTVVEIKGWKRDMYLDETDCPWSIPSPNMPTVDTAVVFPGTVFLEGTEASEGRGTTRPFELVGAPYVNSEQMAKDLNSIGLPGVYFRACGFQPTFQKYAGEICGGVFIHVTERRVFKPVITGVAIIMELVRTYPDDFEWKQDAYEYEFERNAFDVIAGTKALREMMEAGKTAHEIAGLWQADEKAFRTTREKYLLYTD